MQKKIDKTLLHSPLSFLGGLNDYFRDIKPGNVMINDDGQAVLMDLGSATKARVEIKTRSEAQTLQVCDRKTKLITYYMGLAFHGLQ